MARSSPLVAQPSPLGLPSHSVEHLRIDPNGDQPPASAPKGPPHASHRSELADEASRMSEKSIPDYRRVGCPLLPARPYEPKGYLLVARGTSSLMCHD